jgi:hypothetical protein
LFQEAASKVPPKGSKNIIGIPKTPSAPKNTKQRNPTLQQRRQESIIIVTHHPDHHPPA